MLTLACEPGKSAYQLRTRLPGMGGNTSFGERIDWSPESRNEMNGAPTGQSACHVRGRGGIAGSVLFDQ